MKRILFIMDNFPLGGIAKSMLTWLELLKGGYEIDLLLMHKEGLFVPLIPDEVNLISDILPPELRSPSPKAGMSLLRKRRWRDFAKWSALFLNAATRRVFGGLGAQINYVDRFIARNTPKLKEEYDAAVAFQGGRCIYYLVDKVKAGRKLGFVHSDYAQSYYDHVLYDSDKKYFPRLDALCTISPRCRETLRNYFPALSEKMHVVENICSPTYIKGMARQGVAPEIDAAHPAIVSMGRLDIDTKGVDFILDACRILKDKDIDFRWYWLGDGAQRQKVEAMARERGVADRFVILGARINPYPYIEKATVYAQPSRFEGKSVALDEVKALAKPVLVTDFTTVFDQFTPDKTALVVDKNAAAVAGGIAALLSSPDLRQKFSDNLRAEKVGNEHVVNDFLEIAGLK